jgi:hypothetical protein
VARLSTIGADAPHENLLTRHTLMEQSLQEIGLPAIFLRPGCIRGECALGHLQGGNQRETRDLIQIVAL